MLSLKPLAVGVITFACIGISCTNDPPAPPTLDKDWTLEASPNGLDKVGVIFAIDSAGEVTRIPGGALKLETISSPVAITQQTKTKNISAEALFHFLAIKGLDSLANAGFQDTAHLNASFVVNKGTMTVIGNEDIGEKFKAQGNNIANNIKLLRLEDAKLFLILETIKSPNVSITLDRTNQTGANLAGKLKKMVGVDARFKTNVTHSSDLVYNGNDTLTIFYKLRQINVNISRGGPAEEKTIHVSLGEEVRTDEILGVKGQ